MEWGKDSDKDTDRNREIPQLFNVSQIVHFYYNREKMVATLVVSCFPFQQRPWQG